MSATRVTADADANIAEPYGFDLTSLKANSRLRLKSLECSLGSMNLAGFRPTKQKSAQVRFRCAVYSLLWLRSVPSRSQDSEDSTLKGAYKWQMRRKQQLLLARHEGSDRGSSKHS